MSLTFLYGLVDPRNSKLRYIGKSDNPQARLSKHIREAKRSTDLHRLAWIRGLLNEDLKPNLLLLMQVPQKQWQRFEQLLISSLNDNPKYDLTNMADGGLGGSTGRGRKRSKRARENISQGLTEFYANNEELKDKARKISKEKWANDKFKAERIAQMNTPEAKKKRSESQLKRWANQDEKEKQSRVSKRNWADPELSKLMREKIRARWQDPEYREKQRKARLESWARRKRNKSDA